MIAPRLNTGELPVELGDGLILRRSSAQDAEALADFNARIHSDEGPDKPDERVWAWSYDLMAKPHPTFQPDEFTIVEDEKTHRIVSAMNLIPQTWTYAGIPFKVGRPELVGTLPEYRNRGLVKRQFGVIHQWSVDHGEKVQAITGIPYYYRLFDYEMAMNLHGGRAGYTAHVPRLKEGEAEPYTFRPAAEADISFLSALYAVGSSRSLVACTRDDAIWKDELTGKSEKNVQRLILKIIESDKGERLGYIGHPFFPWGEMMVCTAYELIPGASWREVTPSVIRYLENYYIHYDVGSTVKKPFAGFGFWTGEDHPVYHVIPDSLPRIRRSYAWYLRLADVPDFLRLITPVLEKRLAESYSASYTGEVKVTFYRDGLRLVLEKGKFMTIEAWKPMPYGHAGDAAFPPHTFLQLLFGYRSIETLKQIYPDCWTSGDHIHVLLDALFPHQVSDVWPVS